MNKNLKFCIDTLWRAFAVAGYSFFGLVVATQDIKLCLTASGIAAGSYFFTELVRYFKLTPPSIKEKSAKFKFLVFP